MKKILTAITLCLIVFACGSDDGGDGGTGNTDAAVLTFPENNSECTAGTPVSQTQSAVTFQWNEAADTETYFLYVKNLITQNTLQYTAGANTFYELTLDKATPYSWYVSASKTSGTTAKSETWKFYNAGDGITNYAPFPADAVYPAMSASVYGPVIALEWQGGDPDGDIDEYNVYMDTNANPVTLVASVTAQTLPNVAVTSGTTYYWKVVTTDDAGNTTTSPVYQFKVL